MFDVVIVGGGSAGIATAASLLRRNRELQVAIVEPREEHFYQPGWTLVGAGIFPAEVTRRPQGAVIPSGANWVRAAVERFSPGENSVLLSDGRTLRYRCLVICPGLTLDWEAIAGLPATLGKNGVTSNYRYDLAPYTDALVREFKSGKALFTQPQMPIKCAGAPQKAMYLSCHRWEKASVLSGINVEFHTSASALFGVAAYVPALMEYVKRYGIELVAGSRLVAVDGDRKVATFERSDGKNFERAFDMLHVVPPQVAPDFIRSSQFAASTGFVDVDETTLRHRKFWNVFALGDVCATSNAKTAAAVRKQAPIVAVNVLAALKGQAPNSSYDGYGSCPLTVEIGKIVLAEFGYNGVLKPSFPKWFINGLRPSRLSWVLKSRILPQVYWNGMLKGREWLVSPHIEPRD